MVLLVSQGRVGIILLENSRAVTYINTMQNVYCISVPNAPLGDTSLS